MAPKVPPISVKGPEKWLGVESLPRVRELEQAGLKRQAIARIFGISLETLRNAEKKEGGALANGGGPKGPEAWRTALDRFVACGIRGVNLPDEALDRESIYTGRP